ncbi:hypothetical protein R1sor_016657 [Riccia sorocarpa]|uniref:Shwachman-Bodian-Diamond syndrome protein n=1 Tax=Riccia sorocarpa TaxID=122646 RepID=A0ABD3HFL1_9MARC
MSRTVKQPIGQKRLTNVAVVRLKKHGNRFEIACYKNKVLSWRSRVEKDIDEVLQTHTVFSNVSKGVLAKSKDLLQAFGTDDHEKISLEKGELQVADKEREVQLSSQFRDIATIVMHKTVNPETERPYTISMIERLMKEVHFAVEPNKSSKQQALELIRELTKHFRITRARMRLKLVIALNKKSALVERLSAWSAVIESQEEANKFFTVVCQLEPGHFRECDILVRDLEGRLEVTSMAVQKEGDGTVEDFTDAEEVPTKASSQSGKEVLGETSIVNKFSESFSLDGAVFGGEGKVPGTSDVAEKERSQEKRSSNPAPAVKQQRCNTCNAEVGDSKQYREHFKSDWHKHNLKRKTANLPPLSPEECLADTDIVEPVNDLNEYSR